MEMGVSLSRRRQSPGRGFWEGGRVKRANERQVTWGRTPVLRKRRNRRRLPCQPAPPPRPNRHPPPCPPDQSAVSNASPAGFITPDPDPTHPNTPTHPNPKPHGSQRAATPPRAPSCPLPQRQRHRPARASPAPPRRCQPRARQAHAPRTHVCSFYPAAFPKPPPRGLPTARQTHAHFHLFLARFFSLHGG